MLKVRTLLNFLDKAFVKRLIYMLLLVSAFPLLDIFVILRLGSFIDNDLIMAGVTALSVFGFLLCVPRLMSMVQDILNHVRYGRYPGEPFQILIGGIVSAVFLIIPGPITFLIGLLLMIRFARHSMGKLLLRESEPQLRKMYEYIKLYEG